MEYKIHKFKNGLRLIHAHSNSMVAHCGIIVNTGSRDESENEHGMAHFVEHAIFKGTKKRRSYHIINRLESVGGDINAYTSKEETCVYSVFLNQHYERTLDLLSDMFFHSNFPAKEIEKEKTVIIDEINSYKDNPAETIYEEFEELMFQNSSLGRNILGTPERIKTISNEELVNFYKTHYATNKTVIYSVGNIDFKKLVKLSEKYFAGITERQSKTKLTQKPDYKKFTITKKQDTHQLHCIIGNSAYDMYHKNKLTASLLNNIIASNNMSSRLNIALREKHGYAYDLESNYTGYSDTGMFHVYFGTDKQNFNKSINLINKEFEKLRNQKLGALQLHRAQQQLMGQIAISKDRNSNFAYYLGKSLLFYNEIEDLKTLNKKISSITAEMLIETANELLEKEQLSMLVYKNN